MFYFFFFLVERAYVLAHFLRPEIIKSNYFLQTCLSCLFSHLIISIHDPNIAIAQKTILGLKALPQSSLNVCFFLIKIIFKNYYLFLDYVFMLRITI